MVRHTPGPWRNAGEAPPPEVDAIPFAIRDDSDGQTVAYAFQAADANLVTAAPDLFAAMHDLLVWEKAMGGWENPVWAKAKAAYRAAKGAK